MSRLPERDLRASSDSRFKWRPSNALIAVIFIVIFTVGPYLAFTGHVPFTSYGYEVNATFSNSANIALNSPVRIAGVDVGKVISTSRDGDATKVTFTVDGAGRPIHDDAFAAIRPRIFLEGNFFLELDPGSPSAPELDSGGTIPVSHTSTAVQLDEVLTSLQSPVRADLGELLDSYGEALTHKPTAAENLTQLPEVKGKTGAEALNGAFKYGGDAGRYSAQVTNALLGTEARDLSRLVAGAGRTFGAFASSESDLQGLIDNFNVFTGALANQSANLSTTIHLLAPTLRVTHASLVSLNRTLPPLRTYAIELTPAVAELPDLIAAGKPWLGQVRPLLSGSEGGGVARLLAESTPGLAGAAQASKEKTLPQINQLSLCTTKVLVPTGNQTINDQFSTGGPNYREFLYTLTNLAGAGQDFDGNGPYVRSQLGGGDLLVGEFNPGGNSKSGTEYNNYANTIEEPIGNQPQLGGKPELKPNRPCYKNPVPDINGPLAQVGPHSEHVDLAPADQMSNGTTKSSRWTHFKAWITRQARGHRKDTIAIVVLALAGIVMMLGIFTQQKASLPSWLPLVGEEFEHISAEFATAQAVTPGQGQAVDIAGIQIGKVTSVDLEDGHAVVGMDIEPKYMELIHPNATFLLRPKTNLNDMVVEVSPGSGKKSIEDGAHFTLSQTEPNTNLDAFLATLDADTRQYLQLLLAGGAQGIGGRGKQLSNALRRFQPFVHYTAKLNKALAQRHVAISRVIHDFGSLTTELGQHDADIRRFVSASNASLGNFANQQQSIQDALQEFPSTLRAARAGLASSNRFSIAAFPALTKLIPQAQASVPAFKALQGLFNQTTAPIQNQIRPFTREIRPVLVHANEGSGPLDQTVTNFGNALGGLNAFFNELAYKPKGSKQSFLFYLPWLNHNFNASFNLQDAGGPQLRSMNLISCAGSALGFGTLGTVKPFLTTLLQSLNVPFYEDLPFPGKPTGHCEVGE